MRLRPLALLLFAVLLCTRAYACSCAYMSGHCAAAKPGDNLFLGNVLSEKSVRIPMHFPGRNDLYTRGRIFRIHVTESFGSSPRTGEDVDIRTGSGSGGGDCGFGFIVGRTYLVDAYQNKPDDEVPELRGITLSTGICSRTATAATAAVLIAQLRTELAHGRQPDLMGAVVLWADRYGKRDQSLAGVPVTLRAVKDGVTYNTLTDEHGLYRFGTLPSGAYTAAFQLPPHTVLSSNSDKPPGIIIPANNGTGLACRLDAFASPSGSIAGRVIDASGKPVQGGIYVYPHGRYTPEDMPAFSEWAQEGAFTVEHLPDDDYDVVFNKNSPKLHGIARVQVQNGEAVKDVEIRLP